MEGTCLDLPLYKDMYFNDNGSVNMAEYSSEEVKSVTC